MDHILQAIFYITATTLLLLPIFISSLVIKTFSGKSLNNPDYPPVIGTVFHRLFYFTTLYDYQIKMAKKHKTWRLLSPEHNEIYTTEPRNIEHILKTNFGRYSKGESDQEVVTDLFGQGIFAVDGDKWRQQRKLASFELSERALRDFSCAAFRKNAATLVGIVLEFSESNRVFYMQALLMRFALDSSFKVGFGVDLNCFQGSNNEANEI